MLVSAGCQCAPIGVQEDSLDLVRPEQERAPPVLAAVLDGLRRLLVVDGRPVLVHRADCRCRPPPLLPRAVLLAVAVRHRRRHSRRRRAPGNADDVGAAPVMAAGNDDSAIIRRRLRSHALVDAMISQCLSGAAWLLALLVESELAGLVGS